jgi:hypothetical protein
MIKMALIGTTALVGALAASLVGSAPALAFTHSVSFLEDSTAGFVGPIPTAVPTITIASDGETHFDPFGAGYDTSDGIQFTAGTGWL